MFARFDENPAMTLRVIKETKRYGRTDGRKDGRTDGRTDNVKTVYPLQTKFAGGIISLILRQILGPLVLGWAPNPFVSGAQLAPGERTLVCIPAICGCYFVTQYNSSLSSFVPNFRILTQLVAEKSLTEKKFTNIQT